MLTHGFVQNSQIWAQFIDRSAIAALINHHTKTKAYCFAFFPGFGFKLTNFQCKLGRIRKQFASRVPNKGFQYEALVCNELSNCQRDNAFILLEQPLFFICPTSRISVHLSPFFLCIHSFLSHGFVRKKNTQKNQQTSFFLSFISLQLILVMYEQIKKWMSNGAKWNNPIE